LATFPVPGQTVHLYTVSAIEHVKDEQVPDVTAGAPVEVHYGHVFVADK